VKQHLCCLSAKKVVVGVYRGTVLYAMPTDLPPVGIMPKVRLQQQKTDGTQHWEIDVTDCQMDMDQICSIYTTSLQKLKVTRSLVKMKLTNLKYAIPNFKHFTSLPVLGDALQPDQQLLTKLSEFGLTFSPVAPDGNCFFNSVALNLMSDYDLHHFLHLVSGRYMRIIFIYQQCYYGTRS